ncbi:MAG: radical SAM protein [Thermincolia bacterium]
MQYDAPLFRPPSEAYSLIIQVALGCSHNKCTFCSMYKSKNFKVRSLEEIKADLKEARFLHPYVEKVFLADGDALILSTPILLEILNTIKELFPECKRVGIYGSPKAINLKGVDELIKLKNAGLGIIYMGMESGNVEILKNINKGVTAQEMIEAGQRVKQSAISLSITIISGLGGRRKIQEHAQDTANMLNQINPEYLGLLTLMLEKDTVLYEQLEAGQFALLRPREVILETKILLENLELTRCVFRSNHASNYLSLEGNLPQDKAQLIKQLGFILASTEDVFKKEINRLL